MHVNTLAGVHHNQKLTVIKNDTRANEMTFARDIQHEI